MARNRNFDRNFSGISNLGLYRQLHKHGYEWAKVYKVEAFQDHSTGKVSHRLRRICSSGNNRIALPMNKVYDVIQDSRGSLQDHWALW
jgi:hypothetical protein